MPWWICCSSCERVNPTINEESIDKIRFKILETSLSLSRQIKKINSMPELKLHARINQLVSNGIQILSLTIPQGNRIPSLHYITHFNKKKLSSLILKMQIIQCELFQNGCPIINPKVERTDLFTVMLLMYRKLGEFIKEYEIKKGNILDGQNLEIRSFIEKAIDHFDMITVDGMVFTQFFIDTSSSEYFLELKEFVEKIPGKMSKYRNYFDPQSSKKMQSSNLQSDPAVKHTDQGVDDNSLNIGEIEYLSLAKEKNIQPVLSLAPQKRDSLQFLSAEETKECETSFV